MAIKNIKLNISNEELQKLLSLTVSNYAHHIKSMFTCSTIAIIIAIVNFSIFWWTWNITGIFNNYMFVLNLIILLGALIIGYITYQRYNTTLAMLLAYTEANVKNVRDDISAYIGLFDDWKGASHLRLIEYVLRSGKEACVRILNPGFFCVRDCDDIVMYAFTETFVTEGHKIYTKHGDKAVITITYDTVRVSEPEE